MHFAWGKAVALPFGSWSWLSFEGYKVLVRLSYQFFLLNV